MLADLVRQVSCRDAADAGYRLRHGKRTELAGTRHGGQRLALTNLGKGIIREAIVLAKFRYYMPREIVPEIGICRMLQLVVPTHALVHCQSAAIIQEPFRFRSKTLEPDAG